MTDRDIEQRLRRYQPVGPGPRLRERISASRAERLRVWPWATAAAALLACAVALHISAERIAGQTGSLAQPASELGDDLEFLLTLSPEDRAILAQAERLAALEQRDNPDLRIEPPVTWP